MRGAAGLGLLLTLAAGLVGCATMRAAETADRDRVVVIAGASSGFGKGVALKLAGEGARLVLAARRIELLEEVARECERRGAQAIAVKTDVSEDDEVAALARAALARFGRIDVWINVAGLAALGRFEDVPLDDHHRVVDINLNGVINGSHHALRQFRAQGGGTLINIASMAGRVGLPYYASYSATKAGVIALGAALNEELRLNGERTIHVSTIMPYAADTPWWQHAANYTGHHPSMILMDPPEKVIDAIVRATVHPKPEIAVGVKAKAVAASHRLLRRATEDIAGTVTHDAMMKGAPAPPTTGSLYEPSPAGAGIRGEHE
jgi:short-subunit dehydrogenase